MSHSLYHGHTGHTRSKPTTYESILCHSGNSLGGKTWVRKSVTLSVTGVTWIVIAVTLPPTRSHLLLTRWATSSRDEVGENSSSHVDIINMILLMLPLRPVLDLRLGEIGAHLEFGSARADGRGLLNFWAAYG